MHEETYETRKTGLLLMCGFLIYLFVIYIVLWSRWAWWSILAGWEAHQHLTCKERKKEKAKSQGASERLKVKCKSRESVGWNKWIPGYCAHGLKRYLLLDLFVTFRDDVMDCD